MHRSPTSRARLTPVVLALTLAAVACADDGPAAPAGPQLASVAPTALHHASQDGRQDKHEPKDKDKDKHDDKDKHEDKHEDKDKHGHGGDAVLPPGVRLYAAMDGHQPVPNDLADHAGSGRAEFSLSAADGRACVAVTLATTQYREITGSHIHPAPAGSASPETVIDWSGAIVAQLREDGSAIACVHPGAAVVARVLADPAGFYFNIHTPANGVPDGGILRGQLGTQPH